ncbi:MAG: TIGR02646 family protein [Phycisphaeraceae bacterium]|nr:MAG: TIGR02646 family protein [Phycisphaeraceae bacterium]
MHRLHRNGAAQPACLAEFRHDQHAWENVSSAKKREIRERLEEMQGSRCAYCEASIDDVGHHIEHFRPKAHFPELTFAWDNLLLCCGKDDCCGHYKDRRGWPYKPDDLVSPTVDEPDDFFWFHESGVIEVRSDCENRHMHRATETLRVLNLNHRHGRLRQMRARQLKWYKNRNPDVFEELATWDPGDRREYVQGELEATAGEPFCTIIRHFLQGLAT